MVAIGREARRLIGTKRSDQRAVRRSRHGTFRGMPVLGNLDRRLPGTPGVVAMPQPGVTRPTRRTVGRRLGSGDKTEVVSLRENGAVKRGHLVIGESKRMRQGLAPGLAAILAVRQIEPVSQELLTAQAHGSRPMLHVGELARLAPAFAVVIGIDDENSSALAAALGLVQPGACHKHDATIAQASHFRKLHRVHEKRVAPPFLVRGSVWMLSSNRDRHGWADHSVLRVGRTVVSGHQLLEAFERDRILRRGNCALQSEHLFFARARFAERHLDVIPGQLRQRLDRQSLRDRLPRADLERPPPHQP